MSVLLVSMSSSQYINQGIEMEASVEQTGQQEPVQSFIVLINSSAHL
jgi:hypothetical protein